MPMKNFHVLRQNLRGNVIAGSVSNLLPDLHHQKFMLIHALLSVPICFHIWLDCILSQLGIGRPSLLTDIRSVSETPAYPSITDLAGKPADCPYILTGYYRWVRSLPEFPQKVSQVGWYCQALGVPRIEVSPPELPLE